MSCHLSFGFTKSVSCIEKMSASCNGETSPLLGGMPVMLVAKMENEGLILADKRRNRLAWDLLVALSNKVMVRLGISL
jgi:hypothetical protein